MIQKKQLAVAIAATFVATGIAYAQSTPQKVEKIEITGSNIKRIDAEGPLPVEVITREDIARKGVTTVNELIRSLSYMSSFNDELISNSPNTTGAAGVGFRGLSSDQTVVLLNGRRLASYGFDGAFVSLNSIPLGAIQRVEVLKDGAAAIYGADAIGGVVNFITQRDYQGREVTALYGVSSAGDARELSVGASAGFGSLAQDRFNVLANVSYFKRDPLNNLDRERTRTADFRRFGGGNQLSTFTPTGNFVNPSTGQWTPFSACPDPSLLITPSPLGAGTSCLFDFAPYRTTVYGAERLGGLLAARYQLSSSATAFFEGLFTRTNSSASAAPTPGNFALPIGHPLNLFSTALTVRGRPLQAGPRITENTSDSSRLVLGIEGGFKSVDYNVAIGQAKNTTVNVDSGYFLLDKMNAAIATGAFNPFSLTNPQVVLSSIGSSDSRRGETTNSFLEAKASTVLATLGAGDVSLAAGVTLGREEINDVPGPNSQRGNVFGSIQQSVVSAQRDLFAMYGELSVPLHKTVEAQLALRHDRYDGSRSTTPKIALRFQPTKEVLIRGSYSEGFKMPSLRDLFGGLNQSADSVQDTPGCAARGVATCPRLQYDRFSGGNPTLKPEKASSVNLGFVLQPTAGLRVSADYFMIEKTDELGLVLAQFVIDNVKYVPGATATLNGNPVYAVTRNAGGTITSINTSLGNLGQRKIRGADFGFERRFTTDFGKLSLEGSATYYEQYDYADLPTAPLLNRLGYLNLPRWRSQIRVGIERGSFEGGVTFNSRARMLDRPQSQAALAVTATTPIVGSFDTLDLSASYTGMKNLRVTATAKNMTNRQPPFANNDPRTLGFSQMDSIVGRYFTLGLAYQF